MTLRFQADADLNQKIQAATVRREPAINFQTAIDAGLAGLPHPDVLAIAAESNRVLVTHDLKTMPQHFAQFITATTSPGIIIIPQRMPIGDAVEELVLIWSASEAAEWVNRIHVVPR